LHRKVASLNAPTDNRISPLLIELLGAQALLQAGRLDEAGEMLKISLDIAHQAPSGYWEGIGLRVQSQIFAAQGRAEQAVEACERAMALLEEYGCRLELGRALQQRAVLYLAAGEVEAARAALERAKGLFKKCGAKLDLGVVDHLMQES
jgi:tetratricopeptide (TPR) repeat protein